MSSTPVEIGTLIAVILKAKNLPNKRHIGKQDPYCSLSFHNEKRRTKAIKRGGQHPEWDDEVRFSLLEDNEDEREKPANGEGTPPPPPPKNGRGARKIKGGTSMKIQCFADDPREPELIGEAMVDLTEVLTKGETDEWFTLMNKDKYCGEVYLELTFWSNEPPPEEKVTPKPSIKNKQYAGPGTFVPSGESPSSLHIGPGSRQSGNSGTLEDDHRGSLPSSLRSSISAGRLDLYSAPYEQRSRISPVDGIANDFGELNVSGHRRRDSFPPVHNHSLRPSSVGFSTLPTHTNHGFDLSSQSNGGSQFDYDRPITPTQSLHRATISGGPSSFSGQQPYHPQYESGTPPSNYIPQQLPTRQSGPRYSLPTASSGFMPIPTPAASGFMALPHQPETSGFGPPPSQTPAPMGYGASQISVQSGFAPMPLQTSTPSGFMSPMQSSPSSGFHQNQPYPSRPRSSFQYPQHVQPPPSVPPQQYAPSPSQSTPPQHYAPSPSQSAPPQQYSPSPSQPAPPQQYAPSLPQSALPQHYIPPQSPSAPLQPHSATPQQYQNYVTSTPSPPHDFVPPPPPPPPNSLTSSQGTGSRPLPQQPQQPQNYGPQPPQQQSSLPLPHSSSQSYSTQAGAVTFPIANGFNSIPPPPAPPQLGQRTRTQSYHPSPNAVPPPPPPPPPQFHSSSPSGRPSLPQPPVSYHQQHQPIYQPIPPPPPPPDFGQHLPQQPLPPPPPLQSTFAQPYHPPPQSQWITPQGQSNGNFPQLETQSGRA